MRRLLTFAVLLVLVCVGCGVQPSGVIPGDPAPTGPVNGVTLYFVRNGEVVSALRATDTAPTPTDAVNLLLSGMDEQEQATGLRTDIPPGAGPATLANDAPGPTLTLRIDPGPLAPAAKEQLVCTAQSALTAEFATAAVGLFIAGPDERIGPMAPCAATG